MVCGREQPREQPHERPRKPPNPELVNELRAHIATLKADKEGCWVRPPARYYRTIPRLQRCMGDFNIES
jgi:hypothetical protein